MQLSVATCQGKLMRIGCWVGTGVGVGRLQSVWWGLLKGAVSGACKSGETPHYQLALTWMGTPRCVSVNGPVAVCPLTMSLLIVACLWVGLATGVTEQVPPCPSLTQLRFCPEKALGWLLYRDVGAQGCLFSRNEDPGHQSPSCSVQILAPSDKWHVRSRTWSCFSWASRGHR